MIFFAWLQIDLIGSIGAALGAVSANLLLLGISVGVFISRYREMQKQISILQRMLSGEEKSVFGAEVKKDMENIHDRLDNHEVRLSKHSERIVELSDRTGVRDS